MSEELLTLCQTKVGTLLRQKEDLLRKTKNYEPKPCNFPHYKTMLKLYQSIEEKELFLLEINDKIKNLERENEIRKLKKAFSSIRLCKAVTAEPQISHIQDWLQQILWHNKTYDDAKKISENELYYDVDFLQSDNKETLTWSTRYKGMCTRVCVSGPLSRQSSDSSDYEFFASLYVDGLVEKGKCMISSADSIGDYVVKVLWKGMQEIIDFS